MKTVADPDTWRKPDVKPDSTPYYSYILVYVDDILIVVNNNSVDVFMEKFNEKFEEAKGEGNCAELQLSQQSW